MSYLPCHLHMPIKHKVLYDYYAIRTLEQYRANFCCKRAFGKSANFVWTANHCLTGQVFFMQNDLYDVITRLTLPTTS
jgi:hypothetical protein